MIDSLFEGTEAEQTIDFKLREKYNNKIKIY